MMQSEAVFVLHVYHFCQNAISYKMCTCHFQEVGNKKNLQGLSCRDNKRMVMDADGKVLQQINVLLVPKASQNTFVCSCSICTAWFAVDSNIFLGVCQAFCLTLEISRTIGIANELKGDKRIVFHTNNSNGNCAKKNIGTKTAYCIPHTMLDTERRDS